MCLSPTQPYPPVPSRIGLPSIMIPRSRILSPLVAVLALSLSPSLDAQSDAVECLKQIKQFATESTAIDSRMFLAEDLRMLQQYRFFNREDYAVDGSGSIGLLGILSLGASYEQNSSKMTEEHRKQFLRFQRTTLTSLSVRTTRIGAEATELLKVCASNRPPLELTARERGGTVTVHVSLTAHLGKDPIFLTKIYGLGFKPHASVRDELAVNVPRTYALQWEENAFAGTVLVEVGPGIFAYHLDRLGHEILVKCTVADGLEKVEIMETPKLKSFPCHERKWNDIPDEDAPHGGSWGRADKWLAHNFSLTYTAPKGRVITGARGHCSGNNCRAINPAVIAKGARSVRVDVANWTHPQDFWMTVDLAEPKFKTVHWGETLRNGKCTIRVVQDAQRAEIQFSRNNVPHTVVLQPVEARVVPAGVQIVDKPDAAGMKVYEAIIQ